ncbi:hypothetical protein J7K07_07085 [Candidatus Bathyarchaeota archaeon]|nr:hypothetical protein [Candidatus Bathyarchaeota archaeon]
MKSDGSINPLLATIILVAITVGATSLRITLFFHISLAKNITKIKSPSCSVT